MSANPQSGFQVQAYMQTVGVRARAAARLMAAADSNSKNAALIAIAGMLESSAQRLQAENQKDLEAGRDNGLSEAMLDRLELTEERISSMAEGLRQVASLPDPVGEITDMQYRPSGIQVGRMRVPLGVIGIIYESRPNVTADAAALCLKSGNACILRGGSEAIQSNQAIAVCIQQGLQEAGLPADAVQVIETTDREAVGELIRMQEYVDVIVPRGGKGLIERISREARVPVIKHLDGICHVYIDDDADLDKAMQVAFNAKTQRYGTCNTMETLLVSESIAGEVLPELGGMFAEKGVEIRGCETTCNLVPTAIPATAEDWDTEYLAPILSVRVVKGLDEAIDHIRTYGSNHTDAIITADDQAAAHFFKELDSAILMRNASTQFADGGEFGMGAEIGIATGKLHARGPVGATQLTSFKYLVTGDGAVRS